MYTDEQVTEYRQKHGTVVGDLQSLQLQCVSLGYRSNQPRVREYLHHGVGRRVSVLRHALLNVFSLFPLDSLRPLTQEDLVSAQMNLHAFVINLSGVFDNFAWVYVLRHDLYDEVGDFHGIGMFDARTTRLLPEPISSYLRSESMTKWYQEYLKNYRDALAHRIPLFIPPAIFSKAEGARFQELEAEIAACLRTQRLEGLDDLRRQQEALGKPCPTFLHSYAGGEASRHLVLHPQMIADGMTIVEFGKTFFRHWEVKN